MFGNIYEGKTVLVTGNAGFKGGWLCHWLRRLGATVIGYGHPPSTEPNHHTLLGNEKPFIRDLLEWNMLKGTIEDAKPDLVIHLAAKSIVARTFDEPRETFENNVMGAVNILEACRQVPSVKGIVMITTDKVYEDRNWVWGYRENDKMGGVDPYSASKVCIETVIRCYRESFGMNIATARAGNVIGGGDWSYKRLIPDIVRAASKGDKVIVHTPQATRPWQHVLEPLRGYLLLGKAILEGKDVNRAWNFGPTGEMTVLEVLKAANMIWPAVEWEVDDTPTHPHMVYLLKLDSTESKKVLGWEPAWTMDYAVQRVIMWYKMYYEHGVVTTGYDIDCYEEDVDK
jgi:CDP-glucose 4,6-dehydratase